ncbi:neutral zinc metallopeptidase [Smaragdicoccus niigatensis]|uniref:neutral zinc metallopeptidase n=1 Tax=Smaragdicoccus niigatensis TaxID=359359 RepID=UPI000AA5D05C|nr:neutral zinc metallopeptidase [Smaragdicoccus niigatensis]
MRTLGTAAALAVAIGIASSGVAHAAASSGDVNTVAKAAEDVVNKYWAANFTALFGGTYSPPKVIGPGNGGSTVCGNAGSNDAMYCDGDDTISLGAQFLSKADTLGDIWIYDVVAHETGHAIQQRTNKVFSELGAECFSGAALGGSAKTTPAIANGWDDIVAVEKTVGDSHAATRPGDHGTAEQQLNAFRLGWSQGPKACTDAAALYNAPPSTKPAPDATTDPTPVPTKPPVTDPAPQPSTDPAPKPEPPQPAPVAQPSVVPTQQQVQQPTVTTAVEPNPILEVFNSLS